ncbi:vesicle transport GOT1B [Labeo rohita]|uniref:Vesicle transport GOT1B n=2 Tax=Cyprinoidei TaxID=30727 RepID=A0A498NRX7_LABRO|nr:vesicle transport GOT1B [Labeo rohita]
MISLTDSQKIGMGLTGFGVFFLFFGMILFFDKALLAIGNILFVAGLSFVIGLERTFRFFFQRHKMKATGFFLGGVFVVLIGWPIVGVVLEVYGFFLLFRNAALIKAVVVFLTEIGMGLTGFGVFFLFFGMILFFDKALLAIGNILFVAGLSFVIGLERTFRFFFQRHKMKATGFFLGGVFVVLIGWPIVGVVLEVYGFFLLFRNAALIKAVVVFLTEIGMGLTGFGVFFLFFGMILFFDKALLAIGNILFVAGLSFVIGLERTFRFFFQRHKMKATGFFLGGVFVVLIGWPIVGVVLEVYGFFLLFRGFFPVAVGFIRRVPILGSLLNLPGISGLVDKVGESNTMV